MTSHDKQIIQPEPQATVGEPVLPDEPIALGDDALQAASGGIIAVLIGLARDPRKPGAAQTRIQDGTSNTLLDG